jgi:hypothetical protein
MMAAVAAITLSTATAHAQSASTPSLGEVARQTAAKRAAKKPTTKVYTNASLDALPVEVLTPAPATVQASAAVTSSSQAAAVKPAAPNSTDTAAKEEAVPDENHWREQASTLRTDLRQAKAALEQQKPGTARYEQAEKIVAYFQRRWDTLVKNAQASKVPMEWLEPRP